MNNLERLLQLADEVFDTRHDAGQISVTDEERELLMAIHPRTLSGTGNEDGPTIWILLLPTTAHNMHGFLTGRITEKELLYATRPGDSYTAIYLCSALALPEVRHKGLAKKVSLEAINAICKDHNIDTLFYWPFSNEGKHLAQAIARETGLLLLEKV